MDDPVLLDLPDPYVPDWNSLEAAKSEDPFMFTGVELLKEAATLSSMVAGMVNGTPFKRNEAILLGLLIRMNRLTRLILKDTCDDKGEMQLALARMLIDSATTLFHLVDDTDGKLFDAFVYDSLVAEREMLKTIRQMRASRGEELSIEKRMESSIKRSAEVANVDLDQLPARRDIGWPSAEERATHLGPTGYVGYRGGSSPIHGTWNDLRRNYITEVEGGFEGQFDPISPRPQPLFTCALLVAESALRYLETVKTSQDVSKLREVLNDLQVHIRNSDDLHESFLNK